MNYEDIRKARLQKPFRPFILRMKNGQEHFIQDEAHLAISQHVLAFWDASTGITEHRSPDEAESLRFVEEAKPANA